MMTPRKDFLFEIGTEELPAKQLEKLQESLQTGLLTQLKQAQLSFEGSVQVFATPRRLAILIPGLQTKQQEQLIERKGPSLANAFDAAGQATKAYEGFVQSYGGTDAAQFVERDTEQGTFLFAIKKVPGKSAQELLPNIINQVLNALPITKPMHWGNHAQPFLRPVRWVILLLGDEIIPANFFGLAAQKFSCGNRFMVPEPIEITEPKNYPALMKQAFVMPNFTERKAHILHALNQAAKQLGAQVLMNEVLLNEVTGLVEWPAILIGNFNADFLSVPNNALIAAMESHQKSFALVDQTRKLLPHFLIIANLASKDSSKIIEGNERVIHARLSDAQFFYEKDCATPLQNHYADLARVTFQTQLGSMQAKSNALAALAAAIAQELGFDQSAAREAGRIAKCDLRTNMVGEFPELQGEMGEIYARKQGLPEAIACALSEQYLPRFADDVLPKSQTGTVLALADRLLNLVGLFGVGQNPTGSKDPFALRRAAVGVYRIIIEKQLTLDLKSLLISAESIWAEQGVTFTVETIQDHVYDFIIDRLRPHYLEYNCFEKDNKIKSKMDAIITNSEFIDEEKFKEFEQRQLERKQITKEVIESVLCLSLSDLTDIDRRIQAINHFVMLPEAKSLAAAEKRVRNLFQKEEILPEALGEPDPTLFTAPEEHALLEALLALQVETTDAILEKNYAFILQKNAELKKPIDDFFNQVMVMTEDKILRHNRLALLNQFSRFSNQVADMSKLVV